MARKKIYIYFVVIYASAKPTQVFNFFNINLCDGLCVGLTDAKSNIYFYKFALF